MEKEIRTVNIEYRVDREEKPIISGYAAVFNSESEDLGGFTEFIEPGAFKEALKTSDTRALFNHDSNFVLGRESAGTLSLKEDSTGLHMDITPPDTQFARDLMVSIERGDINQQSFGFTVETDEWTEKDKKVTRTIKKVGRLYDVSPVTYPAYPDTTVAVRSLDKYKETLQRQGLSDPQRRQMEINLKQLKIRFERSRL